jgi:hypothetical protein
MNRNLIALPAAVIVALALAGCGGDEPAETATSESPEPVETSESPSPTPEPSPTEDAKPTDDTPSEASDGTDYDACFDGTCEVELSPGTTIEVDEQFDIGSLHIVQFMEGGDGVIMALQSGMTTTFYTGSSIAVSGGDATEGLGLTLMSVSGDTAIIAFYPTVLEDD